MLFGIEKHQVIEATLTEAFNDIKALMDNARTLVALAQRLKESHTPSEEEASNDILFKVGIVSAVTKESAGSLFHVELAKQVPFALPFTLYPLSFTFLSQPRFILNEGLLSPFVSLHAFNLSPFLLLQSLFAYFDRLMYPS